MLREFPHPQWLGRLEYRWALRLQRARRAAILAGTAPEAMWLLEHPWVVTTGRRAVADLDDVGLPVVRTERGGLATVHGPGQLVGYLLVDVRSRGGSVKGTVWAVEQGLIDWLATRGVVAERHAGRPGVWLQGNKIAAVGLHFRRGVTLHGFALNLANDLEPFQHIVPCGLPDAGVTSLARSIGSSPAPCDVAEEVGECVLSAFVDTLGTHG